MEETDKRCANCAAAMRFLGEEQIQLGQVGFFFGHLSNLLSGSLDVEIWECPSCGKLDFYHRGSSGPEEDHIAQTICPKCGVKHDLDDPQCPCCGLKNPSR